MKILSTSLKALVVASLACAAGFAAAADTQTLTVSATVVGTCKFSAATNTLAFGQLDQSSAAAVTKDLNVLYKCTKNATSAIAISPATLEMVDGANKLPFTLTVAGGAQTGGGLGASGTVLTAVVTGTIAGADVQAAAAGTYSTDVTLTISP